MALLSASWYEQMIRRCVNIPVWVRHIELAVEYLSARRGDLLRGQFLAALCIRIEYSADLQGIYRVSLPGLLCLGCSAQQILSLSDVFE